MIPVLNNILYYLNLAALLHFQQETNQNVTNIINDTVHTNVSVLLQQIPPGPIVSGEVVKFICSVGSQSMAKCKPEAREERETYSFEWEMYQYVEDLNGNQSNENVNIIKLPGQDAEMELKFNDSVSTNPSARCDLVCIVKNNVKPTSASIKLTFQSRDSLPMKELLPPSNFKILDIRSRAAYFSWNPPIQEEYNKGIDNKEARYTYRYDDIVGYIIEYKNGRGTVDWKNEKVTRYEIKDADTYAACVSNLKPWTTYHFRIMSCSKEACSRPSLPIIVRTLEDLPTGTPLDVNAVAVDEKTLKVSWKPPPRYQWNGSILGYNIGVKRGASPEDEPYMIHMFHPLEALGNMYIFRAKVPDSSVPFKIVVQAFNNVGSGPFSSPVTQEFQSNPE